MANPTHTGDTWIYGASLTQNIPEEQQARISTPWHAKATPRFVRTNSCHSQPASRPNSDFEAVYMDRHVDSAPPAVSMSRDVSSYALSYNPMSMQARGSAPTPFMQNSWAATNGWRLSNDEYLNSTSVEGLTSRPNGASLPQVTEVPATFEDPESYIARNGLANNVITLDATVNCTSDASPSSRHNNNMLTLSTNASWGSSPEYSPYLNSPSSCTSTTLPVPTSSLSRQGSLGSVVTDQLGSMQINSFSSQVSHLFPSEESYLLGSSTLSSTIVSPQCKSALADDELTSSISYPIQSCVSQEVAGEALARMQRDESSDSFSSSDALAHMQRNESNDSFSSERGTSLAPGSRLLHVRQKQLERGALPIAPKTKLGKKDTTSTTDKDGVTSEQKFLNPKTAITRMPVVKRTTPKLPCPHCNERPQGFRADHELRRHIERAHPQGATKKAWITVDTSADGKFLAGCKACTAGKQYWAYYNAAAHLRRAHFHPRKRGRRGKNDEKRGGKGGGDDPDMGYLKANWMKEIEVPVSPKYDATRGGPAVSKTGIKSSSSDEDNDVDSQCGILNDVQAAMPIDPNLDNDTDMSSYLSLEMFTLDNFGEHSQGYILDDSPLISYTAPEMLQMHCNDISANAAFSEHFTCSSSFSTAI